MKKKENFCPVRDILDHIGDTWSVLILLELEKGEVMRFTHLSGSIPDISQKMLTITLRSLEQHKLITRTIYPEVPPRVEYALSDAGKTLLPHIQALVGWALQHQAACMQE